MKRLKILVVEDEVIIADNICETLNELGYDTLEPALNFTEAIQLLENEKPDLAILDIHLSGNKTGIDIANKINEDYQIPFIFLTSNADRETVNDAKLTQPNSYLIKPFSKEEMFTAIEIAIYNYSQKTGAINEENLIVKEAFFVKEKGLYTKILFKEIACLKSDHVYVEIVLKTKKSHLVRISLNEIISKLDSQFLRVHRRFIVNANCIQKINNNYLLVNNEEIPIGKTYRKDLINRINLI